MAKSIKVIKCPTCGSSKVFELRQDYYNCKSCGVDFFIDTDDININHRYFNHAPEVMPVNKIKWILIGVFLFVGFVLIIGSFLSSKPSSNGYNTYSTSSINVNKNDTIYKWQREKSKVVLSKMGEPLLFIVGQLEAKDYNFRDNDKTIYIGVYDLKTSKNKFLQKLDIENNLSDSSDIQLRLFEDGNLYVIYNKKNIYRIKPDFIVENIGLEYEKINTDLTIGIAKVEFIYENYGSGFKMVTNNGKQLVYMPLLNKTYSDISFSDAISKHLPNPEIKTAYQFSEKSDDFPDEKIQLVKYHYKYQIGYPTDQPRFYWQKNYGQSGIFIVYADTPYKKEFIKDWLKNRSKVFDYSILASDRIFFSPSVLAFNDQYILIKFKATPADDDPFQLQLLDASTGKIVQTFSFNFVDKYSRNNNFILQNGDFLIHSDKYLYIDKKGNVINEFKIDDLEINKKDK